MVLHSSSVLPAAPAVTAVTAEPSSRRITRNRDTRRVRHTQSTWFYVAADLVAIVTATVIADLLSIYTWAPSVGVITGHFFSARNLLLTGIIILLWLAAIVVTHGYSHQARTFPRIGRENVIKGSLFFAAGLAMVDALSSYSLFRHYALIGLPVGLFLLMISRMVCLRLTNRFRADLRHSFLAIGQVRDINRLIRSFHDTQDLTGLVHGILLTDPENLDQLADVSGIPVDTIRMDVLTNEDFVHTAAAYACDAVWVASIGEFGHRNLRRLSWQLNKLNMRLYLDPMLEGISGTRLDVVPFGPRHALYVDRPRFSAANGLAKRAFDIAVSAVALVLISPIMLITALAIKIEDRGPVFYISERIGYHGKSFRIFKFRSMHTDADQRLQKLRTEVGAEGLFKMKDDPRITKVGKFIRKTSIDELPQFFNSLLGTMSVVGPRPHLQHEVDAFSADMRMRMEVRPGITGLWQVSGRSDLTPRQAEQLDLYYVDNWSLSLDIRTIARTFQAVALSRGAY
ncbi:sugar transferase [Corynebacterium terpenotabidum]|uniref:Putative glycosyltransferase n=1 Tax=Corynebacterium terpenotabidum Y-11 TaxID=1200352 RepID=S4XBE6_9CORY|nr:sugar transferase [Corynebacterium terpenotabidum]AGP29916.1 putative glycosyltransferase [Corynebacterium terpenotabidum Y-11]